MDTIRSFLLADWPKLVIPLGVLIGVLLAGRVVRRYLFRALERWTRSTKSEFDGRLLDAFQPPFMLWVLIAGIYAAIDISVLPDRVTVLAGKALLVLWVVSFTAVASNLSGRLIRQHGSRMQGALPVSSLTENVATLVIGVIGLLIVLNGLGISIMPMLTALGVGGLAVALALQDTLANFFAGFYLSIAGQLRLGDYIKLETGEEGYIADIAWRTTTIRALPNNLIIIPNSKLSQAIVTNYHLPEKRMSLLIPVGVSYDCDPDHVERVLVEEATKGAEDIPGLLAEPAPFVRFIPGFGDSSLNFTLICQVQEFVDQYLVQHELRKRIFRRFRQEGIEIPFPSRTLHIKHAGDNGSRPVETPNEQAAIR
ncbi:MAG: mechanosensitive ion channel family protein [Bryobacteraceae bacterium]